jgi:hypothetical protein
MIIIRSPLEVEKEYDHFLYLSPIEVLYIEDRGNFVYGKCAVFQEHAQNVGLTVTSMKKKFVRLIGKKWHV